MAKWKTHRARQKVRSDDATDRREIEASVATQERAESARSADATDLRGTEARMATQQERMLSDVERLMAACRRK